MKQFRVRLVRQVTEFLDVDVEAIHDDVDLGEAARTVYAATTKDDARWTRDADAETRAGWHVVTLGALGPATLRVCESAGGDYFVRPV